VKVPVLRDFCRGLLREETRTARFLEDFGTVDHLTDGERVPVDDRRRHKPTLREVHLAFAADLFAARRRYLVLDRRRLDLPRCTIVTSSTGSSGIAYP
jgi:hypothetical protein